MGWSCSHEASRSLDLITRRLEGLTLEGEPANVFKCGQARYFYEVNRKTHDDGGITGKVFRLNLDGTAEMTRTFKINGDGTLAYGPACFSYALRIPREQYAPTA